METMRTKVFAYKGFVGIVSNPKAEGLLNDPLKPGQLGFIVDADYVDIQPEALELLKKVRTSGDDIGEVDAWKCADGKTAFSWLGGPWKVFSPDEEGCTSSRTYDPSLLKATEGVETPQDFIEFIEKG
jgi:hypothetical protein